MVAPKTLHLVGACIDDVEKLAAHRDHPVARGAFRLGGADQSEADRYRHVSALVHCKRYITVSAVTWVHGRLQGGGLVGISDVLKLAIAKVFETPTESAEHLLLDLFASHPLWIDALLDH